MVDELKIKQDEELFDLETLITEGVDAQRPIEIEFPNGKKAAAQIKPITAAEFKMIYNENPADMLLGILELGLLNKEGEPIPHNLIEALPMGLLSKLAEKIATISGLELQPEKTITAKDLMKKTELFP